MPAAFGEPPRTFVRNRPARSRGCPSHRDAATEAQPGSRGRSRSRTPGATYSIADALRSAHPFVPAAMAKSMFHVSNSAGSKPMPCMASTQTNEPASCPTGPGLDVRPPSPPVLHPTRDHHLRHRSRGHTTLERLDRKRTRVTLGFHEIDLNAEFRNEIHGIDGRRELVVGHHDPVADCHRSPDATKPSPSVGVLDEGEIVDRNATQGGSRVACARSIRVSNSS